MSKEKVKEKKKKRTTRPIPHHSLQEALKIADAIQEGNNGKPWKPVFIADFLKIPLTTQRFRDLTGSAYRYGITNGTFRASTISLTPLGQSITKPTSKEEELTSKQTAVQNIPIYKKIYEHYKNGRLPSKEDNYFPNILEKQFGISPRFITECIDQLIANGLFAGILFDSQGSYHVTFTGPTVSSEEIPVDLTTSESIVEEGGVQVEEETMTSKVFVSHGKNQKILDAICEILEYGGFEPVVAIKEETAAVPVPDKILESMRKCSFGVMNLSFDDREKRGDGTFGVNQNVLIEIGAAFVLYNKRIILLSDKRVTIPSNLQGLYRCEYEGEEMDYKTTMKLLKALNDFKKPPSN